MNSFHSVSKSYSKQQTSEKVASNSFNSPRCRPPNASRSLDQSTKKYFLSNKPGFVAKNKIYKYLTTDEKFKIITSLGEDMDGM